MPATFNPSLDPIVGTNNQQRQLIKIRAETVRVAEGLPAVLFELEVPDAAAVLFPPAEPAGELGAAGAEGEGATSVEALLVCAPVPVPVGLCPETTAKIANAEIK